MKNEPTKTIKKLNSISHFGGNTNINNNNNNNNATSGNSKTGEKNIIQKMNKYDSSSNNSFKLLESPVKHSNKRAKELSERKSQKTNSIFEPSYFSPDIRRKKFELDVPEFKLDFKSNKYMNKYFFYFIYSSKFLLSFIILLNKKFYFN